MARIKWSTDAERAKQGQASNRTRIYKKELKISLICNGVLAVMVVGLLLKMYL